MAKFTQSQEATFELARRANNKTQAYTPARSEQHRLMAGSELRKLAGVPEKAKAVAIKVKVSKAKTTNQLANEVFAQVKATKGVKSAFQARKAFLAGR